MCSSEPCVLLRCVICVVVLITSFFFFFKQKPAYEMRISDWSSDVCSSDLVHVAFTEGDVDLQGVRFCLLTTCADVTAPVDRVWATDLDLGSVSTQTTADRKSVV